MNPTDWLDLTGHRFYVVSSYAISFVVLAWMAASSWLRDRQLRRQIRVEFKSDSAA